MIYRYSAKDHTMDPCYIDNTLVSWDTMTLQEFVNVIIPEGWEEVFDAASDIFPDISKALEKHVAKTTVFPPLHLVFNPL